MLARLPKRRRRAKMGCSEPSQIRSASHLKWIRGHQCSVNNGECSDRVEAAHVRTGTDGGTSMKPSDCWSIPLCSTHHREQHNTGEASFERLHGLKMKETAAELWRRSPHRPRE